MLKNLRDQKEARDAMFSLMPTCGTLAGIAIGLVGLINSHPAGSAGTLADDILLLSALGFLLACYLIYFAMRHLESERAQLMLKAIDLLFLCSLTLMVVAGFVVTYEFI